MVGPLRCLSSHASELQVHKNISPTHIPHAVGLFSNSSVLCAYVRPDVSRIPRERCCLHVGTTAWSAIWFFSTAEGRLRSHLKAVQKAHSEKLTKEEKVNILLKTPLVAMDLLPDNLKRRAYEASRKRAIPLYRCNFMCLSICSEQEQRIC